MQRKKERNKNPVNCRPCSSGRLWFCGFSYLREDKRSAGGNVVIIFTSLITSFPLLMRPAADALRLLFPPKAAADKLSMFLLSERLRPAMLIESTLEGFWAARRRFSRRAAAATPAILEEINERHRSDVGSKGWKKSGFFVIIIIKISIDFFPCSLSHEILFFLLQLLSRNYYSLSVQSFFLPILPFPHSCSLEVLQLSKKLDKPDAKTSCPDTKTVFAGCCFSLELQLRAPD